MIKNKDNSKDEILEELSNRVFAIDAKRNIDDDADLKKIATDYIDALDELTDLDKSEIERIANEVIAEYELKKSDEKSSSLLHDYRKVLIPAGIVFIFIIGIIFSRFFGSSQEQFQPVSPNTTVINTSAISDTSQITQRSYYIRSKLAQVLNDITMMKMYIGEYYMATGELLTNIDELGGITIEDFEENESIDKFFLTKNGGVGVSLSKDLGVDKSLILIPKVSKSGAMIKWRCETNVEQKYLGVPKAAFCICNPDLESIL